MWDYDPPPFLHMVVFVSLVLIPYSDDVLIIIMGMNGGRMGGLSMPFGRKILHVFYASFFKDNIGLLRLQQYDELSEKSRLH